MKPTPSSDAAATSRRPALPGRAMLPGRPTADRPEAARPAGLPRETRICHVFRTLGRGLVAEYEPG